MATYTSNLNLKKPALDDDALITDINNNMDILDAAANGIQDALAIVATGNTHAAITSGQFVYVRNHSTLTEGLYVASSNIAANATLSSSNLTANSSGGLNTLNEQIGSFDIQTQLPQGATSLFALVDSLGGTKCRTFRIYNPSFSDWPSSLSDYRYLAFLRITGDIIEIFAVNNNGYPLMKYGRKGDSSIIYPV